MLRSFKFYINTIKSLASAIGASEISAELIFYVHKVCVFDEVTSTLWQAMPSENLPAPGRRLFPTLLKTCATLTLTILPGVAGRTTAGECVAAILTGSAILTRHAGTVIGAG